MAKARVVSFCYCLLYSGEICEKQDIWRYRCDLGLIDLV